MVVPDTPSKNVISARVIKYLERQRIDMDLNGFQEKADLDKVTEATVTAGTEAGDEEEDDDEDENE
jgi:hypothetical protein